MSRLTTLKSAKTRDEVAALLDTSKKGLAAILFSQPIASRYTTFEIPKKHGGTRRIKAPDKKLKLLQQKLSSLLQDCLEEIEATRGNRKQVAHGFKRGHSILSNARQHRNRRWVFNVDLQDFFPSINFGHVRGLFLKDKNFLLQPDVATVLAKIACDENALPQGSPCSPVISNLVAHVLDMHIVRLASKAGCTYTLIASFRSSIASPPVPLFTLRRTPRGVQRKTRGRAVRYSFLVGLFHSLLHAGLSRRTALAMMHVLVYSRRGGVGGISGSEIARMWQPDGRAIALWS